MSCSFYSEESFNVSYKFTVLDFTFSFLESVMSPFKDVKYCCIVNQVCRLYYLLVAIFEVVS